MSVPTGPKATKRRREGQGLGVCHLVQWKWTYEGPINDQRQPKIDQIVHVAVRSLSSGRFSSAVGCLFFSKIQGNLRSLLSVASKDG